MTEQVVIPWYWAIPIIILAASLAYYYLTTIGNFAFGDYQTKREFLLDLIPYKRWFVQGRDIWRDLD